MSFNARIKKLEDAHANRINLPPLSDSDAAYKLAAIIAEGQMPGAPALVRAVAAELVGIFEAANTRRLQHV